MVGQQPGSGDGKIQQVGDGLRLKAVTPGVDRVYADEADVISGYCEQVRAW